MTEADRNQPAQDQQDAPTLKDFTQGLRNLEAMANRLGIKAISTGHGYWPGTEAGPGQGPGPSRRPLHQGDTRVQHRRRAHPRLDLILRKENRLTLRQSPQNTAAIPQDAARNTSQALKPPEKALLGQMRACPETTQAPHRGLKIPPGKEMP